jgi:hypothetical protein
MIFTPEQTLQFVELVKARMLPAKPRDGPIISWILYISNQHGWRPKDHAFCVPCRGELGVCAVETEFVSK